MISRNDLDAAARRPNRFAFLAPALLLLFVSACGGANPFDDNKKDDVAFLRKVLGTEGQPTRFAQPEELEVDTCPQVEVRQEAEHYSMYAPRQPLDAKNLRYEAVFSKTARQCDLRPDYVAIRYGFAGRLIVGPAGEPADVTLPVRVVFAGKNDRVVWSKRFKITVTIPPDAGSQFFTHVDDDLVYQLRIGEKLDDFRIYMGFDTEEGWALPVASAQ
jgi:hypothetical protein